ncbi:major capsid protein P2 [Pseudoalteromonas sp. JB197]|uniref:major capsid protein P2 n=1 Tax=Pseudoalteromonas sp. JB197 TaxID=1434839 RepID=UPI00097EAA6E|nr:major capsid protein P2 [Pseudoalteromonas sp. JB197]SJN25470.1 Outer membrane receptor protein [Pseudoalteromonas sp. JB197]
MNETNLSAAIARIMGKMQPTMIQLEGATGVAYEEEATIKLQAGLVYHSIELETNLKEVPTIEKITVDISGTPVVYSSNVMLDVLDKAYQKFQQEGRFVLDLSKFEFRTSQGVYQTQLVTELTDTVTLQIKFKAKGETDPVVPTLKAKAWVTDKKPTGRIFVPTRYEHTQFSAASGEHTWAFPNGSAAEHVQRMVFAENEVTISEIRVKRGSNVIHRVMRSDLDFSLQRLAGVAPQAGYCILDFTALGFGAEGAFNTLGLNFEFIVSGKGAIKTHIQGYKQVKALPTRAQLEQLVLNS